MVFSSAFYIILCLFDNKMNSEEFNLPNNNNNSSDDLYFYMSGDGEGWLDKSSSQSQVAKYVKI